jgi:hypothetical protein
LKSVTSGTCPHRLAQRQLTAVKKRRSGIFLQCRSVFSFEIGRTQTAERKLPYVQH